MMPGYGGGMGGWGWIFMSLSTLVFLALIAGVVWLVIRSNGGVSRPATGSGSSSSESAREILAQRYARGEIDDQEYQQRLRTLGG